MQDYRLAAYPTDYGYAYGDATWSIKKVYVHTVLQQWDAAL